MTRARVAAGAATAAVLVACAGQRSHLFVAERYDTAKDCLESPAAVDVIEGPDPGTCEVTRCWISDRGEAFVTTGACDAPPSYTDESDAAGTDAPCGRALSALARPGGGRCP